MNSKHTVLIMYLANHFIDNDFNLQMDTYSNHFHITHKYSLKTLHLFYDFGDINNLPNGVWKVDTIKSEMMRAMTSLKTDYNTHS